MIKGAKTIAQYCILKWLDSNFCLPRLKVEPVDGTTVKITDINGDTAYAVYRDGFVYLETTES